MVLPIDLHSHSCVSDGVLTPRSLIKHASQKGVKVLALTDHDTVMGWDEAQTTADECELLLIKGAEFSCVWEKMTIHVLGYRFDNTAPALEQLLASVDKARRVRAEKIAEALAKKGMPELLDVAVSYQKELSHTPSALGRPHFAEAMLRCGYVSSHKEAFQKWLGDGKLGDVKQYWPALSEVMAALREGAGWISLAHPCQYRVTRSKLCRLLSEFITAGGQAMEVSNGFQEAEQVGKLANLVREFGLLASAGSDFHRPHTWGEVGLYRHLPLDLPVLWDKWPDVKQVLEEG